jgi:hypothetical protein
VVLTCRYAFHTNQTGPVADQTFPQFHIYLLIIQKSYLERFFFYSDMILLDNVVLNPAFSPLGNYIVKCDNSITDKELSLVNPPLV